mgnify:CR=1 FL=1
MKTLNHIPIGTEVICSLDNETFIELIIASKVNSVSTFDNPVISET